MRFIPVPVPRKAWSVRTARWSKANDADYSTARTSFREWDLHRKLSWVSPPECHCPAEQRCTQTSGLLSLVLRTAKWTEEDVALDEDSSFEGSWIVKDNDVVLAMRYGVRESIKPKKEWWELGREECITWYIEQLVERNCFASSHKKYLNYVKCTILM